MSRRRPAVQPDLFAADPVAAPAFTVKVDAAYIQSVRNELHKTLALATAATGNPWPDATQCMLEQMRFQSIANSWLPADEAAELWQRFDTEMIRLFGPGDPDDAAG